MVQRDQEELAPLPPRTPLSNAPYVPANYTAEAALLGALLGHNGLYDKVADLVRPEDFADPAHGRIFAAIAGALARGEKADPITLRAPFDTDYDLADRGGGRYLARLMAQTHSTMYVADHARVVADLAKRRALQDLSREIFEHASVPDPDVTARDIVRHAEVALYRLDDDMARGGGPVTALDSMNEALRLSQEAQRTQGRILGVPTGIGRVDRLLSGLQGGNLYVLAGRTNMGKSICGDTVAVNVAKTFLAEAPEGRSPQHVGIFTLEMAHGQLSHRRLSAATDIEVNRIKRGELEQADFDTLTAAAGRLGRLPILADDTPRLTIAELRARARRIARMPGGLGMVVVDHLGLVRHPEARDRYSEVTEVTRSLKALAKELNVPVLALCQLSRKVEEREDKRPMLADLRDSGSIEEDADVVIFIYRAEYYLLRDKPAIRSAEKPEHFASRQADHVKALEEAKNRAELIIAKNRDGGIGEAHCFFNGAHATITDLVQREIEFGPIQA